MAKVGNVFESCKFFVKNLRKFYVNAVNGFENVAIRMGRPPPALLANYEKILEATHHCDDEYTENYTQNQEK